MPSLDDFRSDFDSLRPGASIDGGSTRRTALRVAIGVGYAAAVFPVTAQTGIRTSDSGLQAGEIKFSVNGFEVPAYAAQPAKKTGVPVVLVVQEIFGVTDYIADTCRRLAELGYLTIAPSYTHDRAIRAGTPKSPS